MRGIQVAFPRPVLSAHAVCAATEGLLPLPIHCLRVRTNALIRVTPYNGAQSQDRAGEEEM